MIVLLILYILSTPILTLIFDRKMFKHYKKDLFFNIFMMIISGPTWFFINSVFRDMIISEREINHIDKSLDNIQDLIVTLKKRVVPMYFTACRKEEFKTLKNSNGQLVFNNFNINKCDFPAFGESINDVIEQFEKGHIKGVEYVIFGFYIPQSELSLLLATFFNFHVKPDRSFDVVISGEVITRKR